MGACVSHVLPPHAPQVDFSNDNQCSQRLGRITPYYALRLHMCEPFNPLSPREASSVINPIVQMQ